MPGSRLAGLNYSLTSPQHDLQEAVSDWSSGSSTDVSGVCASGNPEPVQLPLQLQLPSRAPPPIVPVMQIANRTNAYTSYRYAPRNTGRASRRLRV